MKRVGIIISVVLLGSPWVGTADGYKPKGSEANQKLGRYVADKSDNVIGRVVEPGPLFDKSGNICGYIDSNGQTVGCDQGEKSPLVGELDNSIQCRNEIIAGEGEAKVCHSISLHGVEGVGMNAGFSTIDDAVLAAAQSAQNNQCQIRRDPADIGDVDVGVEIHINGYERGGKYFYGDSYWFEDTQLARKSAPHVADDLSSLNLRHVFCFHNHPNTKERWRSDTFSSKDIESAVGDGIPSYMMPCYLDGGGTVPRLLRFDPATGVVSARAVDLDKNGKVRYAGEWYKDNEETKRVNETLKEIASKSSNNVEEFKVASDSSNSVEESKEAESNSVGEVGIKGWCSCRARSIRVGGGYDGFGEIGDPTNPTMPKYKYSYWFCLRCGKCKRPNSSSRRIFDNQLEMQLATAKGLRTSDYVNARKDVEKRFIDIPDGQIVFPGKCTCKNPDPIQDAFKNNYVCVICGLCYVPVGNNVPIGPTAREEMGLK